jgi:acyl-CoA thioester hydrolase
LTAERPFEVMWRDADPAGWVHYASVSRYFDVVEDALVEQAGIVYAAKLEQGTGFPRVRFESEFKRPLRVNDRGVARARVEAVGRSSITLAFELRKDGEDEVAVAGRVTMVMVDWTTNRPVQVPDQLRRRLLGHETS